MKKGILDLDQLRRLSADIAENARGDFPALVKRLTEEGMKLTKVRNGAGGSNCTLAGITASSTAGDHGAVTNWANAARRAILHAEGPGEATDTAADG